MSERDYYDILEISREAKQEEIQRAYRKLARNFHPDVNKSKEAEEKFKEVNEVYEVLKDPEKKSRYDLYGSDRQQRSDSSPHEWGAFSGRHGSKGNSRTFRFTGNGGFAERSRPYRGSADDLAIEITLSPMQARRGGNVRLNLPVQMHCPTCYRYSGFAYNCWRCNGKGVLQGEKPVLVNYPAGIVDNHTMKLAISDSW